MMRALLLLLLLLLGGSGSVDTYILYEPVNNAGVFIARAVLWYNKVPRNFVGMTHSDSISINVYYKTKACEFAYDVSFNFNMWWIQGQYDHLSNFQHPFDFDYDYRISTLGYLRSPIHKEKMQTIEDPSIDRVEEEYHHHVNHNNKSGTSTTTVVNRYGRNVDLRRALWKLQLRMDKVHEKEMSHCRFYKYAIDNISFEEEEGGRRRRRQKKKKKRL